MLWLLGDVDSSIQGWHAVRDVFSNLQIVHFKKKCAYMRDLGTVKRKDVKQNKK